MNIFISHDNREKSLAECMKKVIESNLPLSVFVSSCPDALIPGEKWLPRIKQAIEQSRVLLLIWSQTSLSRPWINFEAGCGWIKGKRIIPIYHSGLRADQLQSPANELQGLYLEDDTFVVSLLDAISKHFNLCKLNLPPNNVKRIHQKLLEAIPPCLPTDNFTDPQRIYKNTQDNDFLNIFISMINNAKNRIVLIGTGLETVFSNLHDFQQVIKRDSCRWEIFMANPFSTAVEMRLLEEETGSPRPPVGKQGLITRIESLLDMQYKFTNLEVKLFSHYPTISLFIIDNDYFYYPYGFSTLGNFFSPVSHYSVKNQCDSLMIAFLNEQYEIIKRNSVVDARLIYDLHCNNIFNREEQLSMQSKLVPFAAYLVPDEYSELYRFGSEILGYDLRGNKQLTSKWPEYVKTTSSFGFHLTVADALYFAHEFELNMVIKEIRWLAKELRCFELEYHLEKSFPDDQSISLVCTDNSGILEILHNELVRICYKRSIASNYSPVFGEKRATPNRNYSNRERNTNMMVRYRAPYIMQEFRPHFSLLSGIPADKIESVFEEIKKITPGSTVKVSSISILTKSQGENSKWEIVTNSEVPLG